MLKESFKDAALEICGSELRQRWSQCKGVTLLVFKNITLPININSYVDTQFTVTTSSTGAIQGRRTPLFLILTVTIRTDLCSHSTQQVHRRTHVE